MERRALGIAEGRRAFGADPENNNSARPPYPDRVYDLLRERCDLRTGTRTFEIGAGTGLATRQLLATGATPLVAIEPDERLAAVLRRNAPSPALSIVNAPFETADLAAGDFDLGASATAFHWLTQRPALSRVATLLRPGGWWAMWWNVFGDPERADPFHAATHHLMADLATTPSQGGSDRLPFGLDAAARSADLASVGSFDMIDVEMLKWTLVLTPAQVRALYATYSHFSVLDAGERERLLDGLEDIAETQFAGRVERNMCTAIYTARRR